MLDPLVISGEDVCCSVVFRTLLVVYVLSGLSVVCIGRRYVCCSECYVVSNECDEPTSCLVNLSARTVVKLCTLGVIALGVSLVS